MVRPTLNNNQTVGGLLGILYHFRMDGWRFGSMFGVFIIETQKAQVFGIIIQHIKAKLCRWTMSMKYVRYKVAGDDRIIMFDEHHSHSNMMFCMGFDSKDVVSAGMVDIRAGRVVVSGESTTLQRRASADDIPLISRYLIA